MIEVKVVFDGDEIIISGKRVKVFAEYGYDTNCYVDDKEIPILEDAIKYCMEN